MGQIPNYLLLFGNLNVFDVFLVNWLPTKVKIAKIMPRNSMFSQLFEVSSSFLKDFS